MKRNALTLVVGVILLLIFFLLSNTAAVEVLPSTKTVKLPESTSDKAPKETVVLVVNGFSIAFRIYLRSRKKW